MADKSIGELKKATALYDTSLLPMEQDGEAQALSGALLRKFAEDAGDAAGRAAVTDEVEQAAAHAAAAAQAQQGAKTSETNAKNSENAAAGSATKAAQSEKNAAQSATTAQQYSGKPPQPIDGTWWIWDAATGSYKDSGVSSILRIVKSYTSIEAMEADYGNMQDNDLVIIATDVELEENSKLYIHTPTGWRYLSDLSGIQGPPGPQGEPFEFEDFTPEQLEEIRGPQGTPGKPPIVGDNGNWHVWDGAEYIDTGYSATALHNENGGGLVKMWFGTIAEYNALDTIYNDVLYHIIEGAIPV